MNQKTSFFTSKDLLLIGLCAIVFFAVGAILYEDVRAVTTTSMLFAIACIFGFRLWKATQPFRYGVMAVVCLLQGYKRAVYLRAIGSSALLAAIYTTAMVYISVMPLGLGTKATLQIFVGFFTFFLVLKLTPLINAFRNGHLLDLDDNIIGTDSAGDLYVLDLKTLKFQPSSGGWWRVQGSLCIHYWKAGEGGKGTLEDTDPWLVLYKERK